MKTISVESNHNSNMEIITTLKQGKEFAEQLQKYLLFHPASSSTTATTLSPLNQFDCTSSTTTTTQDYLLDMIFTSYNKLFSMINVTNDTSLHHQNDGSNYQHIGDGNKTGIINSSSSPQTTSGGARFRQRSTTRTSGDRDCEDQMVPLSKKRKKMLPIRSENVKVNPEAVELDGGCRDGYSWRKYGQKKIHCSIYPRNYYRCKYSTKQNCSAKKQVQKSNDDPTILHVIYLGDHTCHQCDQTNHNRSSPHLTIPQPPSITAATTINNAPPSETLLHSHNQSSHTTTLNTNNPVDDVANSFYRSLSFSALPHPEPFDDIDLDTMFQPHTPAGTMSDLNHFAAGSSSSTCNLNFGSRSGCSLIGTSESDLNETLSSAPDSVSNSPIGGECWWSSMDDFNFDICADYIFNRNGN